MRTFYIIEKAKLSGVQVVVLANGVHSPLEQRTELERCLRDEGVRGRILFDLFLSFGTKSRRYFFSHFDGNSLTPLEQASEVPQSYTTESAELLKRHLPELDLSVLSSAAAFAVQRGFVISN